MAIALDVEVLDATVFIGCLPGQVDLADTVAEILDDETGPPVPAEVRVDPNEDADADRAAEWPGGFLFFPSVLEIFTSAHAPRRERGAVMSRLLSGLWSRGIAAVAACEYEDLLPSAGGTGDRSLPWPTRRS